MTEDVAEQIADCWGRETGLASPEGAEFWVVCRELAMAGFVQGNSDALSARQVGPFRIATKRGNEVVTEFVENFIPAYVTLTIATGDTRDWIAALAASTSTCFVTSMTETVSFGTGLEARQRWTVLLAIKTANRNGEQPTIDQVRALASGVADVDAALMWLAAAPAILGSEPVALIREDGGRYSALA
jgi:hypothetical protein